MPDKTFSEWGRASDSGQIGSKLHSNSKSWQCFTNPVNKVYRQLDLTNIINFSAGELSSNTQWLDLHGGLCPLREDPARGICVVFAICVVFGSWYLYLYLTTKPCCY